MQWLKVVARPLDALSKHQVTYAYYGEFLNFSTSKLQRLLHMGKTVVAQPKEYPPTKYKRKS